MPPRSKGVVRTSLVRRRETAYADTHGPCQICGSGDGLAVFWRDRANQPMRMQSLWSLSDGRRAELYDQLLVLCGEHMRLHLGGVEHGGGVAGVKGCDCVPCKDRRREYIKLKHREHRAAKKGQSR